MKGRSDVTKSAGSDVFIPMAMMGCLPMTMARSLPMIRRSSETADRFMEEF